METSQPTWKRPVYIGLTMLLWAMVGLVANVLWAFNTSGDIPAWRLWSFVAVGALTGWGIGRMWYRLIYVDGDRWHRLTPH